jgi:cytochrome P450
MTPSEKDQLGPLPAILRDGTGPITPVIAPTGDRIWMIRDYALARLVLTDQRFSRAGAVKPHVPKFTDAEPAADSMMSLDGAAHARLRRTVAGAFSTGKIAALTPHVQQLTDDCLDLMLKSGPSADIVSGLAAPLSLAVMCALLGIPPEDHKEFQGSVEVLFDITRSEPGQKARRRLELVDYMTDLMERKHGKQDEDLLTVLIGLHDRGELSRGEMITLGLTLLMAGYETTIGEIGLAVLWLLSQRGSWRTLCERPESLAPTVEELLRLTPSTPVSFSRVLVEPVRLGDITVNAGETVIVSLLHGNRDAKIFAEPAQMLPGARHSAHLTFGHGVHRCLGAPLARMQIQTALARLSYRFPGLRLAPGHDAVAWKDGLVTRGLTRLLVTW